MLKSLVDGRSIALALVLALAAALPSMTTSRERREYYLFDLTLTSTSPGDTQLFWDLGRGYNENDSSRQPLKVEPKPVVYRYMMPMGDFKALRLDPLDGAGTMTLAHAQIVDARGKVVHRFRPADFKAFNQIARMEIQGDTLMVQTVPGATDAILELEIPRPLHLASHAWIWLDVGLPVALPAFLLGLIVGCPAVASRLHRLVLTPLGRWLQGRPHATIAVAALVALAVQCHPVIFQGRSFASPNNGSYMLYGTWPTLPGAEDYRSTNTMSSDTGALLFNHVYYPMMERTALQQGELPLWNRYSLGGMPLLGQGQSGFGEPLNFIPILANGAAWAWDLRFLLARWLFAAGLAFTVWRLTRHLAAAVLVTVGSVFIGFFMYRLNHPANFGVCFAPLILLAWTGLIQAPALRRQLGWLAGLVLANWMVMTSGTVKEAYMTMVCVNLAGAILLFLRPEAHGRRGRVLGLAAVAGFIFTLLSAPLWISFLVALRHSFTVYDQPTAHTLPLAHLIGFFDDIFYRQTAVDEIVVAPALNFVFLPGVLWWLVSPRLWRTDRTGLALVLGGALPLAMAFGIIPESVIIRIPFVANIHHIYNTFSCPLLVVAAVLAGCGFSDAFQRTARNGWWLHLGAVLAVTAGLIAVFFHATRGGYARSAFSQGYVPGLLLALCALPAALRWLGRTGRPGPLYVACALGLPLLLWRHAQYGETFFNQYAFVPGLRNDLHAPSAGVRFIDAQAREPGRRCSWGGGLFPAYNIALNWEGMYGVDTLRGRYYNELALAFDLKRVWNWDWANKAEDAPRLVPLHDMLNTDYYIADHAAPAREFAGLKLVQQLDLDVYQSPTAWPRAFFTDRLAAYGTVQEFTDLIQHGDRRPFAAGQKGQTDLPALPGDLAGRTIRPATGYRLTTNHTSFVVDAPGPGIAVLTEAYYDQDFEALVDGKPAPYFRVNHAFKGVVIPGAGRHEVSFAYWPLYTTLSLWLFATGVALAAAAAGLVYLQPKQR